LTDENNDSAQPPEQTEHFVDSELRCPQCGYDSTFKDGIRRTTHGEVQRYLCRNCSHRFSLSDFTRQHGLDLNPPTAHKRVRQVCDDPMRASCTRQVPELAKVETRSEIAQREGILDQPADAKGKLIEFTWWMKKQGYAEQTILGRTQILKVLTDRSASLLDPESIKTAIAGMKDWCEGRKANAVNAYNCFLKMHGGKWDRPRYKEEEKLPWIPLENEVNDLIAGCSLKVSCFLRILKKGALRPGEAWRLKWTDVDNERGAITMNRPEKHTRSRQFKISTELATILRSLQRAKDAHLEKVFNYCSTASLRRCFERQRKRIAFKTGNPRLLQISFRTLRHWKATMEYHRTKDILHVMNVLGHKRIENTLKYTHLVDVEDDKYVSRVAQNTAEACTLVDAGFEYVTGEYDDGGKIFRKRT